MITGQIRIVLLKRKMAIKELSEHLGTGSQNLSGIILAEGE
jgi:DNA-binding Xre family transcriptional regulator